MGRNDVPTSLSNSWMAPNNDAAMGEPLPLARLAACPAPLGVGSASAVAPTGEPLEPLEPHESEGVRVGGRRLQPVESPEAKRLERRRIAVSRRLRRPRPPMWGETRSPTSSTASLGSTFFSMPCDERR